MVLTTINAKVCNAAYSTKSKMMCYIMVQLQKDLLRFARKNKVLWKDNPVILQMFPKKLRNKNDKRLADETKTKIQVEFPQRMSLTLYAPKALLAKYFQKVFYYFNDLENSLFI